MLKNFFSILMENGRAGLVLNAELPHGKFRIPFLNYAGFRGVVSFWAVQSFLSFR